MKTILLTIGIVAAAPATAFAYGAIGCADLPEHDRAVGALQGMTGACDMSVEQARRILAQDGSQPASPPEATSRPRKHRAHHRAVRRPY